MHAFLPLEFWVGNHPLASKYSLAIANVNDLNNNKILEDMAKHTFKHSQPAGNTVQTK